MSSLNTHITIPKDVSTKDEFDFKYLKQLGVEYIQTMGGKLWTDFNVHDPGITILEVLSYAITDLGNRIAQPIEDLLSPADGSDLSDQFYRADEILSVRATTALDYRKLFIDLQGVRNCWLVPYKKKVYVDCLNSQLSYNCQDTLPLAPAYKSEFYLKGLYSILVDFDIDEDSPVDEDDQIAAISEAIKLRYQANRNLCEDLVEIKAVEDQEICVCAVLEINKDADVNEVNAAVLFAIESYFAPSVSFHSLNEMLAKGYTTDQIFDGPLLDNGFIDTTELKATELRKEVRLSDLLNVLSEIEGVELVKDITIAKCGEPVTDEWMLCIDAGKRPVLCENSTFSYVKDVIPSIVNDAISEAMLSELRNQRNVQKALAGIDKIIPLPTGKYNGTEWYSSIQNDFPDVYGIGFNGLPSHVSTERKAQAKQLKAYLLFFDQVLASYFAHLGKVRDLLSFNSDPENTYFSQPVEGVTDFSALVNDYAGTSDELSSSLMGALDDADGRKNAFLDHLIGRFAEKFSEYTFLMKELYGSHSKEMIVYTKQEFLKEYVEISSNRGGAFNYYKQPISQLWNTSNVSGAEKRIARLAGMKNYNRRNLSNSLMEIYDLQNSDGDTMYRWRIRDLNNDIILSGSDDYLTPALAENEMYFAILKIIETDEDIAETLTTLPNDETILGNLLIQKSPLNKYSIDIINREVTDIDDVNYIIARQFKYYLTLDELKDGITELIRFMKYDFTEEGMFMVEHILLRPDVTKVNVPADEFIEISASDCNDCGCTDPYSYRLSVVLPGYTQRFGDIDFRNFMEELIREELPAHILPRICWIGSRRKEVPQKANELWTFEVLFKEFLKRKTNRTTQSQHHQSLVDFRIHLMKLHTIYPAGKLTDCENPTGPKTILGRTNLGTLSLDQDEQ